MKKLQCELCTSIEIVKEGEFFVCQSCGCRYTMEEARRMITLTVDRSTEYENLVANARSACNCKQWHRAWELYGQALNIDASDAHVIMEHALAYVSDNGYLGTSIDVLADASTRSLAAADKAGNLDLYFEVASRFLSCADIAIDAVADIYSSTLRTIKADRNLSLTERRRREMSAESVCRSDVDQILAALLFPLLPAARKAAQQGVDAGGLYWDHATKMSELARDYGTGPTAAEFAQVTQTGYQLWFSMRIDASGRGLEYAALTSRIAEIDNQIAAALQQRKSTGVFKTRDRKALNREIQRLQQERQNFVAAQSQIFESATR